MIEPSLDTMQILESILGNTQDKLQQLEDAWAFLPPEQRVKVANCPNRIQRAKFLVYFAREDLNSLIEDFGKVASFNLEKKASE